MEDRSNMTKIWDNYKLLKDVKKTDATLISIGLAVKDGVKFITLREFYLKKSTNEWKPSTNGINIPIDQPLKDGVTTIHPLADLLLAIPEVLKEADAFALYDEKNAVYIPKKSKQV